MTKQRKNDNLLKINMMREYQRRNKKWTIQRNWQHTIHKNEDRQYKNTTQYILDTTIGKQTQIT